MPLSAVRKQVRDLPFEVTLDDSMAMMPQMKLSAFRQLRIGARISRSGQAIAQPGDLQGEVMPVATDSKDTVTVRIDRVLP
jgi:cytochrome c-type biogenesis protein CcmH